MADVNWAESGARDLTEVCEFIERTSPTLARSLATEAYASARSLVANPRMGAVVPEYDADEIRELQVRNHRLLYRLDGEDIIVIGFTSVSRRLPRTPPG